MWSSDLRADLQKLKPQQRHAIAAILEAEANNIPRTRLLKTSYSCKYCGWYAQTSLGNGDQRRAVLVLHEAEHERDDTKDGSPPQEMKFICSVNTFYKWLSDETFADCLSRAEAEFTEGALNRAVHILKSGAPLAAQTLLNLSQSAESENVRKGAAAALLDRADIETAIKSKVPANDPYLQLLAELRDDDDLDVRERRLAGGDEAESDS